RDAGSGTSEIRSCASAPKECSRQPARRAASGLAARATLQLERTHVVGETLLRGIDRGTQAVDLRAELGEAVFLLRQRVEVAAREIALGRHRAQVLAYARLIGDDRVARLDRGGERALAVANVPPQ